MKRILISLFLAIFSISVFADGVWIDGICYNLNKSTNEAEVAAWDPSQDEITALKTVDFNTYNVGDMPCTNKKTSDIQLAKIVNYDGQNALNIPSQGKVNIIEGFEVDPMATYITTFWAISDKDASYKVNFSGNEVLGTGTKDGKWVLPGGGLIMVVVVSKSAEDATEGFLEIETVRGSSMKILKVEVGSSCEYAAEIPEKIISQGEEYIVTSIGEEAFYGHFELNSITIPNSVTSIGNGAFLGCSGLTSVTIPNSVTSIGGSAFYKCSGLTSIMVEEGNPNYDSRDNCNAIIETSTNTLILGFKNTTIPNSVTSIGDDAFAGCSGLTSVTIPNSVTSIGDAAFLDCSGLTSVIIPNSVKSIGNYAFEYCSRLTSVTIGNSVTSIGEGAFSGCSGLTSITIPNSVTSIGLEAFRDCSGLTSVTIGNSVTSIGNYAFDSCSKLKEIHSQAITPPSAYTSTFKDVNTNHCKLYVPKGKKEDYAFANIWKEFMNIIEEGSSEDEDMDALKAQIASLQAQNSALESEIASLKEANKKYAEGDLNLDGRTDIDDVVYLLNLDNYSSDDDALALLIDKATAVTLSDISSKYGDVEFYTLNGVKVDVPNKSGIYVVKKNGETKMVVVKK